MLSRKSSLAVFWSILALIVVTIVVGILSESYFPAYSPFPICAMLGLLAVLLLFCIIQIVQMAKKVAFGKIFGKMLRSFLILLVILFCAFWLTKSDADTFAHVAGQVVGLSLISTIVDTWYNMLNKQKK